MTNHSNSLQNRAPRLPHLEVESPPVALVKLVGKLGQQGSMLKLAPTARKKHPTRTWSPTKTPAEMTTMMKKEKRAAMERKARMRKKVMMRKKDQEVRERRLLEQSKRIRSLPRVRGLEGLVVVAEPSSF